MLLLREAWPQQERVQELLSCPEEEICSPDKASQYSCVEVDPETGKRKPTEGKGTGAANPAPGLDACILHEDDSDQDAYLVQTRCSNRAIKRDPTASSGRHHFGSKFLSMGVGAQKIEGRFDVRKVTKPIVAAGQVTDRGQGGDGGFILDVKSARKNEKLLKDRRGFVELRKQKGVYVIPCEEQSSNLFPLVE